MHFKNIVILSIFLGTTLFSFAEPTTKASVEQNTSNEKSTVSVQVEARKQELLLEKEGIEKELSENNIWSKIYSNYHTYQELKKQNTMLESKIERLEKRKILTNKQKKQLDDYKESIVTLMGKLQLLKEYEKNPFKKFLTPPDIENVPNIENPLAVIGALSYKEKLSSDQEEYKNRYLSLEHIMSKFTEKKEILKKLAKLDNNDSAYSEDIININDQIKTFTPILDIFKTTENVYNKKIDEINLNLKNDIQKEIERTDIYWCYFTFLLAFTLFY